MSLILHQLAGRDDFRFSPFSWRARMALAHKGLDAELRDVKFSDRAPIAPSGQERLPVLVDGDSWISDSWAIAEYLDDNFPDERPLFGAGSTRAVARFVNSWADSVLHGGIFGLVARDIFDHVHADDSDFFRQTREARIGMSLEDFQAGREDRLEAFRATLTPLRLTLKEQIFLGGATPAYADYIVFGGFQWARCVSDFKILADDDPVKTWFDRVSALHGGLGASAAGY
jgi:glutathione S-transferase